MLAHWNNSLRIDMSFHLDTLSWFQANKFMLFLLNAAYLATNTNLIVFGLNQSGLKLTIYHTQGEHANRFCCHKNEKTNETD
jgi:hypothetical protein